VHHRPAGPGPQGSRSARLGLLNPYDHDGRGSRSSRTPPERTFTPARAGTLLAGSVIALSGAAAVTSATAFAAELPAYDASGPSPFDFLGSPSDLRLGEPGSTGLFATSVTAPAAAREPVFGTATWEPAIWEPTFGTATSAPATWELSTWQPPTWEPATWSPGVAETGTGSATDVLPALDSPGPAPLETIAAPDLSGPTGDASPSPAPDWELLDAPAAVTAGASGDGTASSDLSYTVGTPDPAQGGQLFPEPAALTAGTGDPPADGGTLSVPTDAPFSLDLGTAFLAGDAVGAPDVEPTAPDGDGEPVPGSKEAKPFMHQVHLNDLTCAGAAVSLGSEAAAIASAKEQCNDQIHGQVRVRARNIHNNLLRIADDPKKVGRPFHECDISMRGKLITVDALHSYIFNGTSRCTINVPIADKL
jgi:hypothetical protein